MGGFAANSKDSPAAKAPTPTAAQTRCISPVHKLNHSYTFVFMKHDLRGREREVKGDVGDKKQALNNGIRLFSDS
ncbi:hypothetical protein TIFTF001_032282 [Ficus carica]|uniref:Uncharacterized protein n=1 Tax=Ficus carica TaxID=3494 RepID=A0AA88DWC8_FICCA|nr:hypothetical protein TIFTF001_032282 [Ficus carica]